MNRFKRFIKYGASLLILAILFSVSIKPAETKGSNETLSPDVQQCGQFGLRNSSFFRISSSASSIVSADFNNDGIPDIAAPMPNTNNIAVALGNNQTGFSTSVDFTAGASPQEAVAGDFNRDGEIDLAVTSTNDQRVNILLGDGQGNFALSNSYPVGAAPRKVQAADFNNDGWLDLVVGNTETNLSLSIYLGGASGFTAANPGTITLNGSPRAFKIADFNRDGNLDIITVAQNFFGDSFVRLFNGNGQGAFTDALSITHGELYALDSADFNNDNYPDFATYGYREPKVRVYLNNQNGGFNQPLETLVTWGGSFSLTAGDVNNDGKVDLLNGGFVLLNDGGGNLTLQELSNAQGTVIADFNGDGIADLAAAGGISDSFSTQPYWTFSVSYGLGDAKFEAPIHLAPQGDATSAVSADFNNDGRADIATAGGGSTRVRVSFQNADGSFTLPTTSAFSDGGSPNGYSILVAADFNNDGNMDLATHVNWARSIRILLNNGNGQFANSSVFLSNPPFALTPQYFQTGDFNNDNKIDLLAVGNEAYAVALNNGDGTFVVQPFVTISSQGNFKTLAVGDFNGDGKNDFAMTRGDLSMLIFRGNGDGTFVSGGSYPLTSYGSVVRSSDLNGDNRSDLIVTVGGFTGGNPGLSILIADANGNFTQTNSAVPGIPNDITFGDFNGDTIKDFLLINSPNNAVTLYTGNGNGTFIAQVPVYNYGLAYTGATGHFNQDQKLDVVLGGRFISTAVFYNNLPTAPCITVNDVEVAETATNAQFTVNLSATAAQTVGVDYRVVGRSARGNADFTGVTGRVEFTPGTQTQTVSVPLLADTLDEINETFELVLSNPSSNASLTDNIGVATVIDDDLAPSVGIGDVSIIEGTGGNPTRMMFTASLSSATGRKAKTQFALQAGTAQSGIDYIPTPGTVVFNDGETSKQIVVEIIRDSLVEPDETFKVKLSNPSNLNIADDEANGTIINDDIGGNVQFGAATYNVAENAATATVTITRENGAASAIVVQYVSSNGTAVAGQDYTAVSGSVTFGANETAKTFTVPIINDTLNEDDIETVNLTITNVAGGATLGNPATAVLNIQDDDISKGFVDFDGDGKTDLSIFRPSLGEWWYLRSSDGGNYAAQFGNSSDKLTPADYTGDGKTDIALFRPATGEWFILRSEDGSYYSFPFGTAGDIPAVGDFDSDGKADTAVFRPSDLNWYIRRSSDGGTTIQQFGQNGDVPVVADYDGDGKADVAIYRVASGEWWINRSTAGLIAFQFGNSTDKPVQGDYTGDGKADVALFRPSTGEWFVLRSENQSYYSFPFGANGDIPTPGDYDGDGKFDATVFRPSDNNWYSQRTTAGTLIQNFGQTGDVPVPSAFVP